MQEKKRIPLKRLHRLRNARKQAAETDDLTPMMKAIKAVPQRDQHRLYPAGGPGTPACRPGAVCPFGYPQPVDQHHAHHRQQCFGGVGADEPGA